MAKPSEKRLILAVGAVLIAIASLVGVGVLLRILNEVVSLSIFDDQNYVNSDEFERNFAFILYFVVAGSWTYVVWDATNSTWRRGLLYGIAVLFFGSFTLINYLGADALIPLSFLAVTNILFAFVSTVCVALIWMVNFTLIEAKILKYMSLFALATFGVCLPLVFNLFYFAVRLGMVDKDNVKSLFLSGAVYILSALSGIAVSAINYTVMDRIKGRAASTPSA
ncbi:hypothetical protein SAMN04488498_11981 [Mesorhizobium albiziae]|uniref:Uncharacterized protein n=1 Tax=Neomesorhizobium albiziae TaxID=335020 RepID=A0A1I4DWY1_9HYPH|nr:hypothetical protein [Mesorhizobium albiziae]GLS33756.1 hypothetical protein GCM10007937_54680 [Mesorhizobium albiziae]SFK96411.1 hypothetical protein SAMN04488498_11981 [Mesorhizobium albiziae]